MAIKILSDRQESFLREVAKNPGLSQNFYLTGGTALAGFYLRHRYSEDLDFFSEIEFTPLNIDVFLKQVKLRLGFDKLDYQQSFNRNLYFLHFGGEVLKIEFTYFPFTRIDATVIERGLQIDSLKDIAVNKLFSIYQRSVARDYIDLYCIIKQENFTISDLISQARLKFDFAIDPLQLGTQFMKSEGVNDVPRLIQNIRPEEWREFFREEAKKLKPEILKP